ncbi:UDP-2,3-diacylglucosamine diphosphatase [bacterium]|nr:UDP-2,3-diacylglucosamine diphosphatase [bacterium]
MPAGSKITFPPCLELELGEKERVLFFSDAHLDSEATPEARERSARVLEFLDWAGDNCETLVILGDLFDFYFEYRSVFPSRYLRVLSALDRLSAGGVRCLYVGGNHDFWLGELFSRTLGVTLVRDGLLLERKAPTPQRVLATHGDGLGPGDTGYKILKKLLRNPFLIFLFRLIHPDWGYALARLTSRTSRKYTNHRQPARVEASARTGQALLDSGRNLSAVVLAHTHQPDCRQFENGLYFNSGDWCTHFSYVRWDERGLSLESFTGTR